MDSAAKGRADAGMATGGSGVRLPPHEPHRSRLARRRRRHGGPQGRVVSDRHPELDGDPSDDGPVFGARRRRVLRVVVLIAVAALVLPVVLSIYGVARAAADRACAQYVAVYDADARASRVSFELFAPGGPGWQCFATAGHGSSGTHIANLGLLPSAPRVQIIDERRS